MTLTLEFILLTILAFAVGFVVSRLFPAKKDSSVFKSNKDLDSTLLIIGPFIVFLVAMILGFISNWFFDQQLMTEALLTAILSFSAGWVGSAVTFFFKNKQQMDLMNGNGHNGEQK